MWEVLLGKQQSETVVNKILVQTYKPELAQCLHAAMVIPNIVSLLKATKQGFLKTWTGLTEKSSINTLKNQVIQQWDTCT